jgi:hypothetical protein
MNAAVHAGDHFRVDGHPRRSKPRPDAFYNATPDLRGSAAAQEDYMKSWHYAEFANVSVHEVYPGHYLRFVRDASAGAELHGANNNVEGSAHYTEQMMIDEGLPPAIRSTASPSSNALLRNVRFIVGIGKQRRHAEGRHDSSRCRAISRTRFPFRRLGAAPAIRSTAAHDGQADDS